MKHIIFTDEWNKDFFSNAYIGYVSSVATERELYTELSNILQFPSYFGKNWDALDELYRDFNWIEDEEIVIVHNDLSELSLNDLKTYIGIIVNSIDFWNHYLNDPHTLLYVFPKSEKRKIVDIIHECMQTCVFEFRLKIEDL
ncbi:barstar family protein [Bacteroides sp. AN502(2024)]|uniref:barstar family protein n=1 Tax=Bacteroides sp. AN502(2024) TaxID=3160599 RepID=UPI0035175CCD